VTAELWPGLQVDTRLQHHSALALRPHRVFDRVDHLAVGQPDPLDVLRRQEADIEATTRQSGGS
jgi:hypothetical protein